MVVASFTPSLVNFRGPLIRAFIDRGHQVVGVAPEEDAATEAHLARLGVPLRHVPLDRTGLSPLRDLRYFLSLWRLIRAERPDAILAYTIKPVVYGMVAARLAGIPTRAAMVEGIGYAFGTSGLRQRMVGTIASILYRAGLAAATVVFFLNPDDRAEFGSRRLINVGKARVIAGTGVDLDHYRHSEPTTSGQPTFLMIARLLREKGVEVFAAAARRVRERYPAARFQLLGPFDPHPDGISKAQVHAWEAEGILEHLGVTTDVRPVLAGCSVFVLPSFYREGLPRTSLEALATGRPIITTDSPGCREAVVHGTNGWLVPPRDDAALAEAMMRFLDDPESIPAMGLASRKLARERFDVHRVNHDVIEAMQL